MEMIKAKASEYAQDEDKNWDHYFMQSRTAYRFAAMCALEKSLLISQRVPVYPVPSQLQV